MVTKYSQEIIDKILELGSLGYRHIHIGKLLNISQTGVSRFLRNNRHLIKRNSDCVQCDFLDGNKPNVVPDVIPKTETDTKIDLSLEARIVALEEKCAIYEMQLEILTTFIRDMNEKTNN